MPLLLLIGVLELKNILFLFLDPMSIYSSSSGTGFSFAMKQTTSATAYTGTSTSDYLTTVGTIRVVESLHKITYCQIL